jgi:alpha-beta hydrolase superfamily lysophospholipase
MSDDQLDLRIVGVDPGEIVDGAQGLTMRTTRGPIAMIMHAAAAASRAVICVSGAIGGFDGPAQLYPRMGRELPGHGISVVRLNYRAPNDFAECLIDTVAGLAFVKGVGHPRAALVGHSFGGAIAINAGTISATATTVIAISSQLAGADVVDRLAPKPLLLIHGTADEILPHRSSELIFERAGEPKRLCLLDGADHRMSGRGDELFALAQEWITAHL